jgi:hypothetical protein
MILSFDDFNLEYSGYCSKDYVEVRNGHLDISPLEGRFCGYKDMDQYYPKQPIESYSNRLGEFG